MRRKQTVKLYSVLQRNLRIESPKVIKFQGSQVFVCGMNNFTRGISQVLQGVLQADQMFCPFFGVRQKLPADAVSGPIPDLRY